MEKQLQETAKEILTYPKVYGYLAADQSGLCLTAAGSANEKSSGVLSSIAHLADKLEAGKTPVISLESEKSKIILQYKDSITTAIYKNT